MTLMKPFLIILSAILLFSGIIFLAVYLSKRKKIDKDKPKAVRNRQLNLYLAIYLLVGSLIVGSFIFIIY